MAYFIGKEKEEFIPEILLGSGTEGKVYYNKDSNEAVKIFYTFNGYDALMDEDEALKMSKINTKYILLPRRLVYNEKGFFEGYTTPYIDRNIYLNNLQNYTELVTNLYKDIDVISMHKLVINDIYKNSDNYIYNGSIYLIDPGFYYFSSGSIESVRKINMKRINEFLKSSEVKLVRKR